MKKIVMMMFATLLTMNVMADNVKFQAKIAKQCDKEGGCQYEGEHHECKNNCEKK